MSARRASAAAAAVAAGGARLRRTRTVIPILLGLALVSASPQAPSSPGAVRAVGPDSVLLPNDLPLHEVPSAGAGAWLAVFMTGDGGWVAADRDLAKELAQRGVAVVGLDSRAYLRSAKRSPEDVAADIGRVIRQYGPAWRRSRVLLIGYSRGADIMPFVANRLPADARERVGLLALLGLSGRASFQFHWIDILRDSHRATDLPVAPELERLRGTRILCVYGDDEKDSACRGIDRTLAIPVERDGAHRIYGADAPDLARAILAALPG